MMYNFDILHCSVHSSVTYDFTKNYVRTYVGRTASRSLGLFVGCARCCRVLELKGEGTCYYIEY